MTSERPPVPERPLLRGERVWLRPIEERDLPTYVAGINDTEVGGMAGYPTPQSPAQASAWLGFRHEDVMRHSWRGLRGFEDGVLMSLLRDEWEQANLDD